MGRSGIMWGRDNRPREEKNAAARKRRAEKKAESARVAALEAAIAATRWKVDQQDDGTTYSGTEFDWSPVQITAMLEVKIGESTEFWAGFDRTITRME